MKLSQFGSEALTDEQEQVCGSCWDNEDSASQGDGVWSMSNTCT